MKLAFEKGISQGRWVDVVGFECLLGPLAGVRQFVCL
jgi:hypothetical protein